MVHNRPRASIRILVLQPSTDNSATDSRLRIIKQDPGCGIAVAIRGSGAGSMRGK